MADLTVAGVKVTHPDKVLLPAREGGEDVTKADLARYWEAVAATVLPHLRDRPLTLQRFPDGLDAGGFVQQDAGQRAPKGLHTVDTPRRDAKKGADDVVHHPEVEETADLLRLVQYGTVTLHGWNAVAGSLERPDRLIVDIDPGETADLAGIRDVARAVRAAVEGRGLVAFLQSTGSRGYHVVAPLDGSASHDQVRAAAEEIAEAVAADHPDELTTAVRKDARGGRTFLDIGRNAYGQTAVMPYSPRARPGGPTATPLDWDELGRVGPDQHDVRSIPRRLARKTDPWADLPQHARALS
ncbi:non-homologous end-joining DNA ligase [Actinomycetospora sp. C-140]